jgi:hypothetical protein
LKQEYIILFTRKKKKKTKQAYKIKECRLLVVVRSLRRKECGEAQESRKSSSSRSKWRRRSSKKRDGKGRCVHWQATALQANKTAGPGKGRQASVRLSVLRRREKRRHRI